MKKFWIAIFVIIMLALVFVSVSLTIANIHDCTLIEEWKSWLEALHFIKDTAESNEPAVEQVFTAMIKF
ncbi:MAG: hypothetical protein ACI4L6_00510 [Candidatus Onthoplasma sp.]